jgi:hypothetical protein
MTDSVTISFQDLKDAVSQCEYRCDAFDLEDIWDALVKPQKMEEVEPVEPYSQSFFDIEDYHITKFVEMDGFIHLIIRRFDRKPIHRWYDLMRIKDEILGEESEAVELYPAKSRLVDEDHIYHLYALPNQQRFNFGMGGKNDG